MWFFMLMFLTVKKLKLAPTPKRAYVVPLFFFTFVLTSLVFHSTACAVTEDWVRSMRKSILALDSARTTAVKELENSALSERETADYQDFIIYLNTRVVTYCRELFQKGSMTAIAGLPCPTVATLGSVGKKQGSKAGNIANVLGGKGNSQTRAEKTGDMDDRFQESLGAFDEMLLEEEKHLAARVPKQRESAKSGQGGSGVSSGASGRSGETGSGETSAAGQQGREPEEGSGAEGAMGEQTVFGGTDGSSGRGGGEARHERSVHGTPDGRLPPPQDDDIVARQLREAAEKETDPELKKKLWEEYWKYKGVARKSE
jgi:hypothetical protein